MRNSEAQDAANKFCIELAACKEDKRKLAHALGYIMTNPAEAVRVAREVLSMVSSPEIGELLGIEKCSRCGEYIINGACRACSKRPAVWECVCGVSTTGPKCAYCEREYSQANPGVSHE